MSKIYVLQGSTGEYSDRTDWIVRAYKNKMDADESCLTANQEAADYKTARDNFEMSEAYERMPMVKVDEYYEDLVIELLSVDKEMRMDYTGTSYWVVECDLYE